jgi:hypothetical protein
MLGRSKFQGARFLTGLLAGQLVASTLMATLVYSLGKLAALVVPRSGREILTVAVVLAFGLADLLNRTPHIWRQVPQAYVRTLAPGRLGVVWGFDLALLFTTQKSTSLTWVTLSGLVLLFPSASWLTLLSMTVIGVLAIVIRSVMSTLRPPALWGDRSRPWFRIMRRTAGVALLGFGMIIAVGSVLT